jgi:hypothetical protein
LRCRSNRAVWRTEPDVAAWLARFERKGCGLHAHFLSEQGCPTPPRELLQSTLHLGRAVDEKKPPGLGLPTQTPNQRSDMAEDSFSRYLLLPDCDF